MGSRQVPGPPGRWLIGSTLDYDRDRIGWLTRTRHEYGDVVRLPPATGVLHDPTPIHQAPAEPNRNFTRNNEMAPPRRFDSRAQASLKNWMEIHRATWHN